MNKQDLTAAMLELTELRARADEIERIINAPDKPEIGSFGRFYDKPNQHHIYGHLNIIHENNSYPYKQMGGDDWKHFEPITEAILPQMIKHDGGEYPGDEDDIVICFYRNKKDTANGDAAYARNRMWTAVSHYQVIKRA